MLALLSPSRAAAAPFAYVVNQLSDNVSVIDIATDMVVATIPVGDEPSEAVAITPDGKKAYVTNYQSFSISVIDTAMNVVSTTIPLGERPFGVAITPDGTKAYVIGTDTGGIGPGTNHIFVIDTATNIVSGPFPSGGNLNPPITPDSIFIAITPDGSNAYVTNRFSSTVSVIDIATNQVMEPAINIAGVPVSLAITPDGAKVYVGNGRGILPSEDGPGIVWVIDTATNTVSETITTITPGDDFDLAKRVHGVAITPGGSQAWVTLHEVGKVGVIDVTTDTLDMTVGPISSLPCVDGNRSGCAQDIAFTPDGRKAYITMGGISNKVAVIDTATKTLITTITVGNSPRGIAITPCAPVVAGISGPVDPVQVGTNINTSANFTDSDVSEVHTAEWDWGDGSTSPGTVSETNGSGSVTGSHPYTTAGVYTVTLTVTDNSGCPGQALFQFVVVYDPSAGFVTGGGWIDSPEGAYTPDPLLTGKPNFGFVSKYQKGATVPTGQTEFQFKVANLNFHSASYEWLVVAGVRAQYKGTGTINGGGDYGFMLTAIDGQINGGGGVDKFRIKIWDKNNGDTIVYDNQTGAADGADPSTVLGGGSIVIHKQ